MNILFLMKNYDVGGVEIVTNALGTEFVKRAAWQEVYRQ